MRISSTRLRTPPRAYYPVPTSSISVSNGNDHGKILLREGSPNYHFGVNVVIDEGTRFSMVWYSAYEYTKYISIHPDYGYHFSGFTPQSYTLNPDTGQWNGLISFEKSTKVQLEIAGDGLIADNSGVTSDLNQFWLPEVDIDSGTKRQTENWVVDIKSIPLVDSQSESLSWFSHWSTGSEEIILANHDVRNENSITSVFRGTLNIGVDLNDDGVVDNTDDSLENSGSLPNREFMRVNDNFENYLTDNFSHDDDLQPITVRNFPKSFIPSEEDIWVEIVDTSGTDITHKFNFFKSRDKIPLIFPLDATIETLPDTFYLEAKSSEFNTQIDFTFNIMVGNHGTNEFRDETKDSIDFTLVKKIGDPNYFEAARDYIIENHARFFADTATYADGAGSETMRIVVMRSEASQMTVVDAYNRVPQLDRIQDAVTAYPTAEVIINGSFGWTEDLFPYRLERARGLLIHDFNVLPPSEYTSSSPVPYSEAGWFGQNNSGWYKFSIGEVQTGLYRDAVGGLFGPIYSAQGYPWNLESDYAMMIGKANMSPEDVIFILASDIPGGDRFGPGRAGVGNAAFDSGAFAVFYLDGGNSTALAYRNTSQQLEVQFHGSRHNVIPVPSIINNYIVFNLTDAVEGYVFPE